MAFVGHEFIGVQERMFVMLCVLVVSCDNKTPTPPNSPYSERKVYKNEVSLSIVCFTLLFWCIWVCL
jgi:hypothetical protein